MIVINKLMSLVVTAKAKAKTKITHSTSLEWIA